MWSYWLFAWNYIILLGTSSCEVHHFTSKYSLEGGLFAELYFHCSIYLDVCKLKVLGLLTKNKPRYSKLILRTAKHDESLRKIKEDMCGYFNVNKKWLWVTYFICFHKQKKINPLMKNLFMEKGGSQWCS